MPLVSVLLPTFSRNSNGSLRAAIMSVLEQDMADFELFVVDDCSTDGSAETIQEIAKKDPRVQHIRFERNVGLPAFTCAEAFRKSTGKFIAWQFDDCTWMPNLLSSLIEKADGVPNAGLIYGQAQLNTTGYPIILGEKFDRSVLLKYNYIPNCATLIRREVFETLGWLDPSILLKRICDYDMWVRASEFFQFAFVKKILAVENGLTLPDSLGNSVSINYPLAEKYRSHDRKEYLKIENMSKWDPYALEEWMDESDKEDLAMLVFEHLLRIGDLPRSAFKVKMILKNQLSMLSEKKETENATDENQEIFIWYINKLRTLMQEREVKLNHYIAYVGRIKRLWGTKWLIKFLKLFLK